MSRFSIFLVRLFLLVSLLGVASTPGRAGFLAIEDFEDLTPGGISGQNGWLADPGTIVAADPIDPGGQVLAVTELSALVRKGILVSEGTTRTVFMRFRFAAQLSGSFGLSHLESPFEFSDFGPELNLSDSSSELNIANGATVGTYDSLIPLATDTWYNVWLYVDADADTTEVWLHDVPGADATPSDKLENGGGEDVFGFRTSTSTDLVNFYIKTGSGGSGEFGPLYIDDLYLEDTDGLSLVNPVPEPAAPGLVAVGAVILWLGAGARRRQPD